ncbi:transglycosylase SLT domain-containing protein [Longimicrobium sp.]|uniref:transglycosylase SLT domain-containing protein n=1 Tax=Longimicrobium sp. TaxID=2029185 RepID=UPI002CF3BF4E|nr:transglycosylase SLT domain-containing protein [Longimicrobium sp.]HSU14041.1 transglycosylase SLT domain-containing protein [Longimicrobium sp.]
MQPTRRRPPPPWERGAPAPKHSVGRAHRRFPAVEALDAPQRPPHRYRRAYDGAGDRRVDEGIRLRRKRSSAFDRLRRNPVRHGLIGLGVAGAAAPLAVARYSQQRVDPAHEQQVGIMPHVVPINDQAVGNAWRAVATEQAETRTTAREQVIQDKLQRYGEMGLSRELAENIYDLALQENIEPDVAFGLVRTESEFKTSATSHVGAIGLTQLMPATARGMRKGVTISDLRDPQVNLSIGFKFLRELLDHYKGDKRMALVAYNRGPGIVDRILKRGGDPDNGYADAVISGEGVHR